MSATVKRNDLTKRSRITLNCTGCGSTTIRCRVDDADLYEAGLREHVCRLPQDLSERPALRRMLTHMMTWADQ